MKIIQKKNESIDSAKLTFLEVLINVLFWGIVGQIVILFIPFPVFELSAGWWVGIAGAIFLETHLYYTLSDIVMMSEGEADSELRKGMFIRYGVIVVVMAGLYLTKFINPVAFVFGVLMLKPAVYLQPLSDKIYKGLIE